MNPHKDRQRAVHSGVERGSARRVGREAGSASEDEPSKKALEYSKFYGGKVGFAPRVPVRSLQDFSIWYTPGVAAVSRAIEADPGLSFEYTGRWNTIAIVTDGTRVLGLGNIGPEGALPVMEGKALIYNYLGGVNALPLPVRAKSADELVAVVKAMEPSLGGVNLEDIESPKCFDVLDRLREEMSIPVWHDDQQGTAGVTLAALFNALDVTGRELRGTRIVLYGAGAANVAAERLLARAGADPRDIIVVDSKGILHPERDDIDQLMLKNRWKYEIAIRTNGDRVKGDLKDALDGADVLVAAARQGPDAIRPDEVAVMNKRAIAFFLANPVPEMLPASARAAGVEVVATGRSDFPNQVNNSLLFPAIFRGALDVRAKTITDTMVIEAATELASFAREKGIGSEYILPTMVQWEVYPRVATKVGQAAVREGVARRRLSAKESMQAAMASIERSRKVMNALRDGGVIVDPPE
ncbi:MAG: NADP-dependent malic enzyme [Nitrososphaerota archaeon]|nr:NADP-dependent malic enzyme [Nitrososphaerota archaeon]MDG7014135.1 NADP-dependent malic enzyme [Nitrososphaerota archaeon]MDG7025478.1 NADP-dependent malic enzyme [Nitrososphaerota archaeon]